MTDYGNPRLPDRIWARVYPEPNTGCWLWSASTNSGGYGTVTLAGATHGVHRLVYEALNGNIADGLQLDHLCRTRSCCNPTHLEPVSARENLMRAGGKNACLINSAKTHCPQGHPLSGPNLYVTPANRRHCRACLRASNRASRKAVKAA